MTWTRLDSLAANDPNRFVSGIYVDPANVNRAWVSYSGLRRSRRRRTPGHVFRGGPTTRAPARRPGPISQPISATSRSPTSSSTRRRGDLYASSDFGVYCASRAAQTSWTLAAPGMPNIEVAGPRRSVPGEREDSLRGDARRSGAWRPRTSRLDSRHPSDATGGGAAFEAALPRLRCCRIGRARLQCGRCIERGGPARARCSLRGDPVRTPARLHDQRVAAPARPAAAAHAELVPDPLGLGSYGRAFDLVDLGRSTLNSLLVAALVVPLTRARRVVGRLCARPAPRPLARRSSWRPRSSALMVPPTALLVPRFALYRILGRHRHVGPAGGARTARDVAALRARLLRGRFRRLPRDLYDACALEGSPFAIWRRVAMPLVAAGDGRGRGPGVRRQLGRTSSSPSSTSIDPELYTLPLGAAFARRHSTATDYPVFLAGAVLATAPVCSHSSSPSVGFRSPTEGSRMARLADRAGPRRLALRARRRVRHVRGPGPVRFLVFGDPEESRRTATSSPPTRGAVRTPTSSSSRRATATDLIARLSTSIAGGAPPDVFLMNYRYYGQFAAKGRSSRSTERLEDSEAFEPEDFYPRRWMPSAGEGEQLCMPQNISSLVVYYNRDLFERYGVPEPRTGWTWNDDRRHAATLTRDANGGRSATGDPDSRRRHRRPSTGSGSSRRSSASRRSSGRTAARSWTTTHKPTRFTLDTPDGAGGAPRTSSTCGWRYGVIPTDEEVEARGRRDAVRQRRGWRCCSRRAASTPIFRTITDVRLGRRAAAACTAAGRDPALGRVLHHRRLRSARTRRGASWSSHSGPRARGSLAETGRTVPSLIAVSRSDAFLDPSKPPKTRRSSWTAIPTLRRVPIDLDLARDRGCHRADPRERALPRAAPATEVAERARRGDAPAVRPRGGALSGLRLEGLAKRYGDVEALGGARPRGRRRASCSPSLGPSGCGQDDAAPAGRRARGADGRAGRDRRARRDGLPPGRRNVAMVFQSYALFPHLTVSENIGFGLERARRPGRRGARAGRTRPPTLVGCAISSTGGRTQLSGGERQRVALARALVREPDVLPPRRAALQSRRSSCASQMRAELKAAARDASAATMVHVTHDQVEALVLGDRIAVLRAGVVRAGRRRPTRSGRGRANRSSRRFVGTPAMNVLPAEDR